MGQKRTRKYTSRPSSHSPKFPKKNPTGRNPRLLNSAPRRRRAARCRCRPLFVRSSPNSTTESPRQPAALPDDLVEEILVRVTSPADLARASAACTSFHRLITDPIFLRRYRSLHPPLLLGLININGDDASFEPAEVPLPGAAAGGAIARAADFSFRYVPRGRSGGRWCPSEVYDGRVLLECSCPDSDGKVVLPDLAVCDPLSRRYLLLPPIPDGQSYEPNLKYCGVFFAPSVDEDDETSFRVIMEMDCTEEFVVAVFSSSSGSGSCWSLNASTSWDTLSLSRPTESSQVKLCGPSYAYNCLYYWAGNKLIKLNMNTKEFSTVDLQPEHEKRIILIVEEGNDMLGMFTHHIYDTTLSVHYYTSVQKEGNIANEWQLKEIVPLPIGNGCVYFVCEPRRYIFLEDQYKSRCYTLDFKTMKLESVGTLKRERVLPYLGYPPSISPRRM